MYKFYKYHGAGNDFLLADNRSGILSLSPEQISHLCARHTGFGADGVMLLESSDSAPFRMVFYNPDGSGGMMCGNGGRCIVAFAADLGIVKPGECFSFEAPDGMHQAEILSPSASYEQVKDQRSRRIVRLKMKDVTDVRLFPEDNTCFLDTGTRHLVKFVEGLDGYPVRSEGPVLRNDPRFAPVGTNVNFVEATHEGQCVSLKIRTFEKGVEDETLACGTGIVSAAVAAYSQGFAGKVESGARVTCSVRASIATLSVDFIPERADGRFSAHDIWLTGPTDFVGTLEIML